jgi:3-carboxy-cis,cis-muconate cycloisomerase
VSCWPADSGRNSGEALLELQVVGPAFIAAERCLDLAVLLLEDLQVFPSRMRRNLDGTRGVMLGERFMMALAPRLGRLQAHDLVHEACRAAERDVPLESVLAEIPAVVEVLSNAELQALADPATYLGSADAMCAAVLRQASSVIPEAAHE